jgi:GTP cyclohydrolase II
MAYVQKSQCNLPTAHGVFELRVFSNGAVDAVALVARRGPSSGGAPLAAPAAGGAASQPMTSDLPLPVLPAGAILLRVQDQCLTGEVFSSVKCDCKGQLDYSMALLGRLAAGGASGGATGGVAGLVVYLLQEGRGVGLAMKVAAYALQEAAAPAGLDTVDANRALGLPDDAREYRAVADILGSLDLRDAGACATGAAGGAAGGAAPTAPPIYLLSNNPRKAEALGALGVPLAGRVPCLVAPLSALAENYLRVKAERMAHDIPSSFFSARQDYDSTGETR